MICHTALFKFFPGTSSHEIERLLSALASLKGEGLAIEGFARGENFSEQAHGFTHVVSISFADRVALDSFYAHPAHKFVAESLLKPITADLLLVDYEERSA